jgi:23S rRNA pseudouridine2604 synthase
MATIRLDPKARARRDPKRAPVRAATAPRPAAPRSPQPHARSPEPRSGSPEPHVRPSAPSRPEPRPPKPRPPEPRASQARPPLRRVEPFAARAAAPPRNVTAPLIAPADERVSKRLATLGLASRREADAWIEAGWVRVDGRVAVLGERVGVDAHITIDDAARSHQSSKVTILLNKPLGVVSAQAQDRHVDAASIVTASTRWKHDPSRLEHRASHVQGLAPAGRLDLDSTGLLVLTQDGRIARRLIGDDGSIDKEYIVDVDWRDASAWSDAALARLRHGLELDGVALAPAFVERLESPSAPPGRPTALAAPLGGSEPKGRGGLVIDGPGTLRFVLREGRKRQIRRMCEAVGLRVTALARVRIGRVLLDDLPLGQWRYLRDDEAF